MNEIPKVDVVVNKDGTGYCISNFPAFDTWAMRNINLWNNGTMLCRVNEYNEETRMVVIACALARQVYDMTQEMIKFQMAAQPTAQPTEQPSEHKCELCKDFGFIYVSDNNSKYPNSTEPQKADCPSCANKSEKEETCKYKRVITSAGIEIYESAHEYCDGYFKNTLPYLCKICGRRIEVVE